MNDPAPRRRPRLLINLGEAAAVAAVAIGALSYCESRREHAQALGETEASRAAEAALLVVATPEPGGRGMVLRPLEPAQAIQSQRIILPSPVRADPIDIAAATPSIEAAWIERAVNARLDAAKAPAAGTGWMPVALLTTYAETGQVHVDRALYRLGYGWTSRFLLGRRIDLLGLALIRRGVRSDPTGDVDRLWAAAPHSARGGG